MESLPACPPSTGDSSRSPWLVHSVVDRHSRGPCHLTCFFGSSWCRRERAVTLLPRSGSSVSPGIRPLAPQRPRPLLLHRCWASELHLHGWDLAGLCSGDRGLAGRGGLWTLMEDHAVTRGRSLEEAPVLPTARLRPQVLSDALLPAPVWASTCMQTLL